MGKVITCTCKHTHQDNLYGMGRRYAVSALKTATGRPGLRCSVCGREFQIDGEDVKAKKK